MFLKVAIPLAILAVAANAAELSLEQGTLAAGKPAALSMTLTAGAEAPTGIQFDLEYDAASLDVTVETGPAAKQASKSIQSARIHAGKLRVLIIGFNRNIISDGVLAIVHVSYKSADTGKEIDTGKQIDTGRVFPVHITASSGTNGNAESIAVTARDGSVRAEE